MEGDVGSPRPGPELTPEKYWPAREPGGEDLGLFTTRRDQLRLFAALESMVVVMAGAMVGTSAGSFRWFGIVFFVLAAGIAIAIFVAASRLDVPPSGVWRVDAEGYPTTFVGRKPPASFRGDRGVTRAAFIESVAARPPRQ